MDEINNFFYTVTHFQKLGKKKSRSALWDFSSLKENRSPVHWRIRGHSLIPALEWSGDHQRAVTPQRAGVSGPREAGAAPYPVPPSLIPSPPQFLWSLWPYFLPRPALQSLRLCLQHLFPPSPEGSFWHPARSRFSLALGSLEVPWSSSSSKPRLLAVSPWPAPFLGSPFSTGSFPLPEHALAVSSGMRRPSCPSTPRFLCTCSRAIPILWHVCITESEPLKCAFNKKLLHEVWCLMAFTTWN